jgi:tetratricopeptide (TPR) repeat protein
LKANKYDEAVQELNAAVALNAEDESARSLLTQARQAQARHHKSEYDKAMQDANAALTVQNYPLARQHAHVALLHVVHLPSDPVVFVLRGRATAVGEQAKQKEFDQHMHQGNEAMKAGNFARAQESFNKAVGMKPGDLQAQKGLNQAREAQRPAIQGAGTINSTAKGVGTSNTNPRPGGVTSTNAKPGGITISPKPGGTTTTVNTKPAGTPITKPTTTPRGK